MISSLSAPDPYDRIIEPAQAKSDMTIKPGYRGYDGLTQILPTLVGGETTCVIVGGGQSNISNYAQTSFTPVNAKVEVLDIYNGGVYQVGGTPLPGAGGDMDCWMKRLADKMITDGKYQRVIIVPIGVSSVSFADYASGGSQNSRIAVAAARLASVGLSANYIVWCQGESDNVFGTAQAKCTSYLNSIISSCKTSFGTSVPMYIAKQSYYQGITSSAVTSAQAAVLTSGVLAGPDADSLTSLFRYDNIHWNATGADAFASMWNSLLS